MLPPGSSRPILKQTGCVHSVSWTRPDRKKIHAIWTTGDVQSFPISFQVQKAYGHLGEEKSFSGTSITATDAPFYLIER